MYSTKHLIRLIEEGIREGQPIEYFAGIYEQLFSKSRWNAMSIKNEVFYRARITDQKELFKNISELRYPPSNKVKEKGRLNNAGESVAYLATSAISTFAELNCDYYQPICLAEVSYIHRDRIMFCTAGVHAEYYGTSENEQLIMDLFCRLLTSPDKANYNATIAYANMILNKQIVEDHPFSIRYMGVLYNSAQEGKTNQTLFNIAVKPDVFDECFKITKAMYVIFSFSTSLNALYIKDINTGTILPDGQIRWELSFENMMEHCNSLFKNDVFLSAREEDGERFIIKYPEGSGQIINEDEDAYYVHFKNAYRDTGIIAVDKQIVHSI